jgi:Toprim-like
MSLLDALTSHGVEYHRSVGDPNEITICCPFCEQRGQTQDFRFRLGVNIYSAKAHCFNCGWKSRNALEELSEVLTLGFIMPEDKPAPDIEQDKPELPDDFVLLHTKPKGRLYTQAWEYLRERNVTTDQMREKKMGVSFVGRFAYRIIFPVFYGDDLEGIVTRDFTGKQEPKYLNSLGIKTVYNCPKSNKKDKIVLCEGIFDMLAIERVFTHKMFYDIGALLGHDVTDRQEEILEPYRDIVLWPDADVAGVKGFIKVAKQLAAHHRMFVVPPSGYGKDAGATDDADLRYLWATRTRFTEEVEMRMRTEAAFHE